MYLFKPIYIPIAHMRGFGMYSCAYHLITFGVLVCITVHTAWSYLGRWYVFFEIGIHTGHSQLAVWYVSSKINVHTGGAMQQLWYVSVRLGRPSSVRLRLTAVYASLRSAQIRRPPDALRLPEGEASRTSACINASLQRPLRKMYDLRWGNNV